MIMDKMEAFFALSNKMKIKHETYKNEEFIQMNDDCDILDENGNNFGKIGCYFWSNYQNWNYGWSIIK